MLDSRMRKLFYQRHRQRVENAKSEVKHTAPIVHAGNFTNISKFRDDQGTYNQLQKKQFETLVQINQALRTQGIVNTFEGCQAAKFARSKLVYANNQLKEIEKANEDLGVRILNTRPEVDCHQVVREDLPILAKKKKKNEPLEKEKKKFIIPEKILEKYKCLTLPKDEILVRRLLRPKIYIEVAAQGLRPLGRIVIELYTEACPEVVLEFVRVCQLRNVYGIRLIRSFPQLWLEGELYMAKKIGSLYNVEYDMRALDHGKSLGILSFPHAYLMGFPQLTIPFTISYKPLRVANGNRLAFGKVIAGLKNLYCLQDYGTKNGKPSREMKVRNVGVIPP